MQLSDQVFITGTTLTFEKIKQRRSDLPYPIDEVGLREARTPAEAVRIARSIAENYANLEPVMAPDGVDENWRISNMAKTVAETIERYHP